MKVKFNIYDILLINVIGVALFLIVIGTTSIRHEGITKQDLDEFKISIIDALEEANETTK